MKGELRRAFWKENLLRKRIRSLFRYRSEANCGQEGTDQQHQQVDFHVILRCTIAATTVPKQKAFHTP
jgi:hypothetical protein